MHELPNPKLDVAILNVNSVVSFFQFVREKWYEKGVKVMFFLFLLALKTC